MEVIVQLHAMTTLTMGKKSLSAIRYEARWFSDPVWTLYRSE
jgi:hypothetical protein